VGSGQAKSCLTLPKRNPSCLDAGKLHDMLQCIVEYILLVGSFLQRIRKIVQPLERLIGPREFFTFFDGAVRA
jgi:hypothetical protein